PGAPRRRARPRARARLRRYPCAAAGARRVGGRRRGAGSGPGRARTAAGSTTGRAARRALRRRDRADRRRRRRHRYPEDRSRGRARCRFNVGMTTGSRYDGIADWYDTEFQPAPLESETWEVLGRLLGEGGGGLIDVGCGTGAYAAGLAALGWDYTGVDASEDMLR